MHSFCKCNKLYDKLTVVCKSVLDLIGKGCDLITRICVEQVAVFGLLLVVVIEILREYFCAEQMPKIIDAFLINESLFKLVG